MKRRTYPVAKAGFSPYARYNKIPYKYPDWCRATAKGGHTPHIIALQCAAVGGANGKTNDYWRHYWQNAKRRVA